MKYTCPECNRDDCHHCDMARELAGNYRHFGSFGWSYRPYRFRECYCIVYWHNRDSFALERSNAAVFERSLEDFASVTIERHSHFAVGWVEGASIVVCNARGKLTRGFLAYVDLVQERDIKGILDDAHYMNLLRDENVEYLRCNCRSYVADDAPDNWPERLHDEIAKRERFDVVDKLRDEHYRSYLDKFGWLDSEG